MLLPPFVLSDPKPLFTLRIAPGALGSETRLVDVRRDGRAIGETWESAPGPRALSSPPRRTVWSFAGRTALWTRREPQADVGAGTMPLVILGPQSFLLAFMRPRGKPLLQKVVLGADAKVARLDPMPRGSLPQPESSLDSNEPPTAVKLRQDGVRGETTLTGVRWIPVRLGVEVAVGFRTEGGRVALVRENGRARPLREAVAPRSERPVPSMADVLFVSREGWLVVSLGSEGRSGLGWLLPPEP